MPHGSDGDDDPERLGATTGYTSMRDGQFLCLIVIANADSSDGVGT